MWISNPVANWVTKLQHSADISAEVAKAAIQDLREELVAVRTERDSMRMELQSARVNIDWFRMRFNQLEAENKALVERAYDIKLPVPELQRVSTRTPESSLVNFSFSDMGDDMARKLGLPTYDDTPRQ